MYLYLFTSNHDGVHTTFMVSSDDETFSASPMTAPEESHHPPLMTLPIDVPASANLRGSLSRAIVLPHGTSP